MRLCFSSDSPPATTEEYHLFRWCVQSFVRLNIHPPRCRQSESTLSRPSSKSERARERNILSSSSFEKRGAARAVVLYQFFARNDKLQRARHHHRHPPSMLGHALLKRHVLTTLRRASAIRFNNSGDDDKTRFLEPSCSATPTASASQCSWRYETL